MKICTFPSFLCFLLLQRPLYWLIKQINNGFTSNQSRTPKFTSKNWIIFVPPTASGKVMNCYAVGLTAIIRGNFAELKDRQKGILDFMEALEELLPAVYKIYEQRVANCKDRENLSPAIKSDETRPYTPLRKV